MPNNQIKNRVFLCVLVVGGAGVGGSTCTLKGNEGADTRSGFSGQVGQGAVLLGRVPVRTPMRRAAGLLGNLG